MQRPNATESALEEAIRLPTWRYYLAREAVENGRALLNPEADEPTRVLARHLQSERRFRSKGALRRLRIRERALATALQVFRDPSREMASLIEALILARESTKTIAETCGLSPDAVAWYRASFFSVGAELNNQVHILNYVIRPELQRGGDGWQIQTRFLWKLIAYFCGTAALRALFLIGRTTPQEQWMDPVLLVRRLVSSASLLSVAEIIAPSRSLLDYDPARLQAWLDRLIEDLQRRPSHPLPKNLLEREVASLAPFRKEPS